MCIMLLRRYIHIRWLEVVIVFVVGWGCGFFFFGTTVCGKDLFCFSIDMSFASSLADRFYQLL